MLDLQSREILCVGRLRAMKTYAVLAILTVSSLVLGDTEAQARKAIEAKFKSMSAAFAAKDSRSFESIFADDFTSKIPARPPMTQVATTVTRAQVIRDFESQMKLMNGVKWTQDIKTFKLSGNTAHITFSSKMVWPMTGPDKKQHTYELNAKNMNDWVKGPKGWQVHYSETASMTIAMDGKMVAGMGGGGGRH